MFTVFVSLSLLCSCFADIHPGSTGGESRLFVETKNDDNVHTMPRADQRGPHPVVLVPGLGGSQLWAKLNKPKHSPHVFCYKYTKDFYNIWFSLTQLVPKVVDCCVDNLRLHYDRSTRSTRNTQGVDIQALHFGDPKSVEWLDPFFDGLLQQASVGGEVGADRAVRFSRLSADWTSQHLASYPAASLLGDRNQAVQWLQPDRAGLNRTDPDRAGPACRLRTGAYFSNWAEPALRFGVLSDLAYFSDMAKLLVANGYTRGKDLRAVPYDFRKAPNEMGEFFNKTKKLIEETYDKNGNRSVVMVAHSMGNLVMLYFYNHVVSGQWKDKYIRAHVALSAPWAGSVKSLKLMCSGDSLGVKYVSDTKIRTVERSMPSTSWLMPSPRFWGEDEVLVSTPRRNYTVNDYHQLFKDLGYMDGYYMWQDTHKLTSELQFPEVEMHCLYGQSVKTSGRLVYDDFPDQPPSVVADDGDGTVNRRSLEAFLPWMQHASKLVRRLVLDKVDHTNILKDKRVIQYVLELARND